MKKHIHTIALLFIVIFSIVYVKNVRWTNWSGDFWKTTINGDGRGYYAYLPAAFIYHDFSYKFVKEKDNVPKEYVGNFLHEKDGKKFNKYFIGVSILIAPFFLLAYFFSALFGYELDGYSFPFQACVSFAAIFYLIVGLTFLSKFLKFYAIDNIKITVVLLLLFFGTNLFYYSTMEPALSHIYSFCFISIFIFYSKQFIQNRNIRNALIALLALVIIILVRPANAIVISVLPFLAGGIKSIAIIIREHFLLLINKKSFWAILSIILVQPLVWYLQTGHFLIWSYQGEGFNFSDPHFFDILFSYQKGLFVYTPLIAISILSSCVFIKPNYKNLLWFLFCFVFITYVLSSWWNWYYGDSFGLRAFVDFYPIFIIPLAILFEKTKTILSRILLILCLVCCVALNQFQIDQYNKFILHRAGMNKERYWKVFLKSGKEYSGIFYNEKADVDIKNNDTIKFQNPILNDLETNQPDWENDDSLSTKVSHSGLYSSNINTNSKYSITYVKALSQLSHEPITHIKVFFWGYMKEENTDAKIVISLENKTSVYSWNSNLLKDHIRKFNTWEKVTFNAELPREQLPSDILKVYVVCSNGNTFIDDFSITIE